MIDLNLVGLVGPTHNYAGLAAGNQASRANAGQASRPRAAALQVLDLARTMLDSGATVAIVPPHERPLLLAAGLATTQDLERLDGASLAAIASASAMWVANAATVAPASDTSDRRTHLVVANLAANRHRQIESATTARLLTDIFDDEARFVVHPPHPARAGPDSVLCDEGAANHLRLVGVDGRAAHVFVYGRESAEPLVCDGVPRRQTLEASKATAETLCLDPRRTLFVRQHPKAVAAGVFHNDVAGVSHGRLLLLHAGAWVDQPRWLDALGGLVAGLEVIEVDEAELSLREAVSTYLFNAQIVSGRHGGWVLIAPTECRESRCAKRVIARILSESGAIREVRFVDLRESMRNGGGPACLRLRVPVSAYDLTRVGSTGILDRTRLAALGDCVERYWRTELRPDDLRDPELLAESHAALVDVGSILGLGPVHPFQLQPSAPACEWRV